MYVLTMQHQSILENLQGVITHHGLINFSNALPCYELMEEAYEQATGQRVNRLFWGMTHLDQVPVSLDSACIHRFLDVQSFHGRKEQVFLLLDIPEEDLLLSDYYQYTDQLCKFDGTYDDIEIPWEMIFCIDEYTDHIQAVFGSIKQNQIVEFCYYE